MKGEADRENEERLTNENVQTGRVESHRWLDTRKVNYEAVEEAEAARGLSARAWLMMLV